MKEIIIDLGCREATRIYDRVRGRTSENLLLALTIIERHRQEQTHDSECFVHKEKAHDQPVQA